jgi:hypothetical protein
MKRPGTGWIKPQGQKTDLMPILQKGPLCAAGAHDQVDRDARNHAVSKGASGGGGEVSPRFTPAGFLSDKPRAEIETVG